MDTRLCYPLYLVLNSVARYSHLLQTFFLLMMYEFFYLIDLLFEKYVFFSFSVMLIIFYEICIINIYVFNNPAFLRSS